MITSVDTNVLLDILGGDEKFGRLSQAALESCANEGRLVACEVVWAEIGGFFSSPKETKSAMQLLGVHFDALTLEATLAASAVWRGYRKSGGKRERVGADFLIGGHCAIQADRLLTRDRGFFRGYFKAVRVIDPVL